MVWNFYLNGYNTKSQCVKVTTVNDRAGNVLPLDIEMFNSNINLVNIYVPKIDNPNFYRKVKNLLQSGCDFNFICGNFNPFPDLLRDSHNYKKN